MIEYRYWGWGLAVWPLSQILDARRENWPSSGKYVQKVNKETHN